MSEFVVIYNFSIFILSHKSIPFYFCVHDEINYRPLYLTVDFAESFVFINDEKSLRI